MKFNDYVNSANTCVMWVYAMMYCMSFHGDVKYVSLLGISLMGLAKVDRFFGGRIL